MWIIILMGYISFETLTAITPKSTLIQRFVSKLLILDRNTQYYVTVQIICINIYLKL